MHRNTGNLPLSSSRHPCLVSKPAGSEACATCQAGSLTYFDAFASSFQKEIHAIEIDDGSMDVQRVHSQDPTDSRAALPQGETR